LRFFREAEQELVTLPEFIRQRSNENIKNTG